MSGQENKITPAQARQILEEEAKQKQQAFLDEYKALCIKHGMELVAMPQLSIKTIR